jgi:DNA helicase II / ATP-dependent DNA helicase PcrA
VQAVTDAALVGAPDQLDIRELNECLDSIGKCLRELIPPAAAPKIPALSGVPFGEVFEAYDDFLKRNDALDFDAILARAYALLVSNPRIARHYRKLFRYVLIDEAQDTSRVQYELVKLLFGNDHGNLLVVADPAQSIFGFSGASTEYLTKFVDDFHAKRIEMSMNFRSATAIVTVASQLLQTGGDEPVKLAAVAAPGCVNAYTFSDEGSEARGVVSWIQGLLSTGIDGRCLAGGEQRQVNPNEIAVLARTRAQLARIAETCAVEGVPHVLITSDVGVFDSELFQAVALALRVLGSPDDLVARRALLAVLGERHLTTQLNSNLLASKGLRFLGILADIAPSPVSDAIRAIANAMGLDDLLSWLSTWSPDDPSASDELRQLWATDAEALSHQWRDYIKRTEPRERSVRGFLSAIQEAAKPQGDGVRLLTAHSSKGLEFRAVAIIGMNDGTFPDFRNMSSQENLRGERRLLYVALTRASRLVLLTRHRIRRTKFGLRPQVESRFISQMDIRMGSSPSGLIED